MRCHKLEQSDFEINLLLCFSKNVVQFLEYTTPMFLWCKEQGWDNGGPHFKEKAHFDWLEMAMRDYICAVRFSQCYD